MTDVRHTKSVSIQQKFKGGRGVAQPTSTMMQLGAVAHLAPSEDSELGRQIIAMVMRARGAAGNKPAARAPLTFAAYKEAIQKLDSIKRALHQEHHSYNDVYVPGDGPELRRFVKMYNVERHTSDFGGYVNYVGAVHDALGEALLNMLRSSSMSQFRESDMAMHALVVGGSGSGKSELLKLMVHHYVKHPELGAVLVLDPHRKLTREIARWREFARTPERLVYLDAAPDENPEMVPAFNPLAGSVGDVDKANLATQLADAVGILRENDSITGNMVSVSKHCLRVLLDVPGATLLDLRTMMRADKNHPLTRAALNTPDATVREFFERGFFDGSLESARQAVAKRLDDALFAPLLRRMLTAPQPFDLQAAVEGRKIICVDCGSVGPHADNTLGRLVMAQVAALGLRRIYNRNLPQTPLRVFVDEATRLTSPSVFTILEQLRKVGISLTIGQQRLGDGLDRGLAGKVRDNTAIKLFGRNASMGEILKIINWDGEIPRLRNGQFIAAWGDAETVLLDTMASPHLADDSNAMAAADWAKVMQYQLAAHYRPAMPPAGAMLPASSALDPMDEYPA